MERDEIIALIRYQGIWNYYSALPEEWVLDIPVYEKAFIDRGYILPEPVADERFGIRVVNEHTADAFVKALEPNRLDERELTGLLRRLVPASRWFDIDYLFPKLFIDVDQKRLVSVHVEGFSYDHYVPEGWTGSFYDFYDEIPLQHRYWIDDGTNYLGELISKDLDWPWPDASG